MVYRSSAEGPSLDRYADIIDRIHPSEVSGQPRASVVIVCYRTPADIIRKNIGSLRDGDTEFVIIDNSPTPGNFPFEGLGVTYVAMKGNSGVCVARNLGAILSRSDIVIYLDDDAVPGEGFIDAHIGEHKERSVLAVRGRCLSKTRNLPNRLAFHYDLGPERIPSPIDLEGNSSFKKRELLACGGFNEDLPLSGGWEGVEVSYRLVQMSGDRSSVIYSPLPIIYHDYKSNTFHLLSKLLRHRRNLGHLSQGQTDLDAFFKLYPRERNPLGKLKKFLRAYQ